MLATSDYEWIIPKGTTIIRPEDSEIVKNGAMQEVVIEMDGVAISYDRLRELKKLEGR